MASPTRRDHFVTAAVELITEQGAAALKVGPLCRRLGVTTGSFYHHFDGLGALVEAVLAAWEEASTRVVGEAVARIAEADDAIAVLKHTSITLPHAFEARVRAWALRDPAVATRCRPASTPSGWPSSPTPSARWSTPSTPPTSPSSA